jgi:type I restriction enzyme M protein
LSILWYIIIVNTYRSYQWEILSKRLGKSKVLPTDADVDINGIPATRVNDQEFAPNVKAQTGISRINFAKEGRLMSLIKKEETNDIIQYLLPNLEFVLIQKNQCKVDTTTEASGRLRGDVWISRVDQTNNLFEDNIVALVEAKHHKCEVGDMDWRDAMRQGKEKATKHGLNSYIVTNCLTNFRFYSSHTDDEIFLDGKPLSKPQPLLILELIQTQVNPENRHVIYKANKTTTPFSEAKFRTALKKLAHIYRSCGLKKGDDRIDPTVSFVVLKYIGEKELEHRTLPKKVNIWKDYGQDKGDYVGDFEITVKHIFKKKTSPYYDFKDLVKFPEKLNDEHYKQIYDELSGFHFHGCNFDVFGSIYEEFASQEKKKEFGEFYTRRHITGIAARFLLRNEVTGRSLKICDPACGSGGFLTEAYRALLNNYTIHDKLNDDVRRGLKESTFWGFDNDATSVARTKLNMFLVGDGHTHIYETNDSLDGWDITTEWGENRFDYILTNPPMGSYKGSANINNFKFTNEKRNELLFVEKVIRATKLGGEIAIVVNDGALEAPSRETFRTKLLENCDLYAVISLTKFEFAPYTKEKTYILFMQKKQEEDIGSIQSLPVWHFIVDYDGFANSDKRYQTKFHDDLVELEAKFYDAIGLARLSLADPAKFYKERQQYEREVNEFEKQDALTGKKCAYVEMASVNKTNYHNLLSEYYLRPYEEKKIAESEFNKRLQEILDEVKSLSTSIEVKK